ncbi:MAG: alpha/beta hydrolase family protein [Candidatus Nanopelagicales bacterium]|jgi:dienelactone hydrolase
MTQDQDVLVREAISHWAPRFTTNGVAVADFQRVTASVQRWQDWADAWSVAAGVHEDLGREALTEGRFRSAGTHLSTAAVYYHFGKFVFVDYPDTMRKVHESAVRCLTDSLPYLDPPGERVGIPFEGFELSAILRLPRGATHPPIVIMVPGLDSTKEELRSTEQLFLERGLATLSVDGPGQGESEYDLPIRGDWETVGTAIVDWIEQRDDVDPERIGVWGVSLGGYYAPRMVSGEHRIKACAALAGPYDWFEIWDGLPELTRRTFTFRSHQGSQDEAREYGRSLSMNGRTGDIRCPLLIVFGELDRLIPPDGARQLAEETGATLLMLPDGNHGCMNVAAKHRYKTADWLAHHLGAQQTQG